MNSEKMKTYTHHYCFNTSILSCSISFEGLTWPGPTSPAAHDTMTKCLVWSKFTSICEYWLQPMADKNIAAYFRDLDFYSYAKLLYHFKNTNVTPDLWFSDFIKVLSTLIRHENRAFSKRSSNRGIWKRRFSLSCGQKTFWENDDVTIITWFARPS